ncbi:MAG TPA: glycerate kinase [Anaerolineae bacterium]|nr:glycerate kinase [Anaerolineae bacterium]
MTDHLRSVAALLQQAALEAVEPAEAVYRVLTRVGNSILVNDQAYDLTSFDRVVIVGAGKASIPMADAVAEVLRDRLTGGVVITKYQHTDRSLHPSIRVHEAGHPVPDQNSINGARGIQDRLSDLTARDLIFCVLSGGASALMTLPAENISLEDLQAVTKLLLNAGASIDQVNAVRKHLDLIKGGGLARMAGEATLISLVLSDVVGDDLSVIASGPTAPDRSTFADAWRVIERLELIDRLPQSVRSRLELGTANRIADTPKPGDPLFVNAQTVIVGSNRLAAGAAETLAKKLNFNTLLFSTFVQGEAREVAKVLGAIAKEIIAAERPIKRPACLIWGGETTVTVKGQGQGGRNQELALAAAIAIDGLPNVLIEAFGTDGTDGPTDAAGAITTGETLTRARDLKLDARSYLANNDAYHFFQPLDDLIFTGPTGTNVNDLMFLLIE